jgi:hypothetical protein
MNEKLSKEAVLAYVKAVAWKDWGNVVQIRTKYLRNASLERCPYNNLLGNGYVSAPHISMRFQLN